MMAHTIKPARWALSVPVGVVTAVAAGLILSAVGGGSPPADWRTNVGAALIVLAGTFVTGMVAGARSAREWVQAAMLTFAALVAVAVVILIYAAATEPPR